MTPYFETILCSVAREIYLRGYFTSIFPGIVLYYFTILFYSKTQNFRTNRNIKGALSGLRQFMATESPLKVMKNAFYFTSKALFVQKIFQFLP